VATAFPIPLAEPVTMTALSFSPSSIGRISFPTPGLTPFGIHTPFVSVSQAFHHDTDWTATPTTT
jgi:hypothetical protein